MPRELPIGTYLKRTLRADKRTHFRDLAEFKPSARKAASPVIQFYSSCRNVGNYIAVQGTWNMLGFEADTWDMHKRPVDWKFINQNYKFVIIGGAGLLHNCFEGFWAEFAQNCSLPYAIWGVGVCLPDNEESKGVSAEVVRPIFENAVIVDVRDSLTRDLYGSKKNNISICPSVSMIRSQVEKGVYSGQKEYDVLHAIHSALADKEEHDKINRVLESMGLTVRSTENTQNRKCGIEDVLALYPRARAVVTSRLHGAIISFAFGVPYIAFSFDPKVRAFVEHYGGGLLCDDLQSLPELLNSSALEGVYHDNEAVRHSLRFGRKMKTLIEEFVEQEPRTNIRV